MSLLYLKILTVYYPEAGVRISFSGVVDEGSGKLASPFLETAIAVLSSITFIRIVAFASLINQSLRLIMRVPNFLTDKSQLEQDKLGNMSFMFH